MHCLGLQITFLRIKSVCYLLFKSFIILHFNYCPIVCMCSGRGLNHKIKDIHERALWNVYQDKNFSFKTLLKRDKFVSIHIKNHTCLTTEVVQLKNGHSPEIMKEIFVF